MDRDVEASLLRHRSPGVDMEYALLPLDSKDEGVENHVLEVEEEVIGEETLVPPRPLPVWLRYPKILLWALLPSFLHPEDPKAKPKPLHPSAWLGMLSASFCTPPSHN